VNHNIFQALNHSSLARDLENIDLLRKIQNKQYLKPEAKFQQ
jgi:hypothetical protein